MAEVDTSIYGNLLKPPDPFAQAGQIAGIGNALANNRLMQNQNALFQQEFKAKQAMGRIMQGAVGPDGQVDYNKVIMGASQDPDAAFLAPDLIAKGYANQQLNLQNTMSKLDIASKEQKFFGDAAASLGSMGASVTRGDVAKRISSLYSDLAAAGLADGPMKDRLIAFMGSLQPDGKALSDQLQQTALTAAGATDSLNRVQGAFAPQTINGVSYLGFTDPMTKRWNPVTGPDGKPMVLAAQPGTAERNAPVTTMDATGATHVGTAQQTLPLVDALGRPAQNGGPGAPPAAVPGAGPGPTLANMAAAGVPPQGAPPAGSTPISGPVTKLSPETQAWLTGRGDNAVLYAKNLQQEASAAQTQIQMIQQLQDLSHQFHPGAGADIRAKLGGVMQALGLPQKAYDDVSNGSLSVSQAFQKYGVQNTMNVLRQAIGGQGRLTNLEFEQFLHSNPNLDTDPRAIDKILGMAHKIYMLKIAEQRGMDSWVKAGNSPSEFPAAWTNKLLERGIIRPGAQ